MRTKKWKWSYMLLFTTLLIGSLLMFVPYLWMVLTSFKSNAEILTASNHLLPQEPTLSGYRKVLGEVPFFRWFLNSLSTSAIVTIGAVFTSALAGYIFAKFRFRGKRLLFVIILATMMVPFQIVMVPTYIIISKLNLVNDLAAIVIPYLVSAFGVFLAKQFIEAIPNELIEAARMDGASEFRTFWSLVLPQIRPALSALAIFSFMTSWNNYLWPLIILNEESKMTVPLALVFFNGQNVVNYNVVMSAAVLIMIPVVIIFLIFQRQFIKGLTMTGFK
ncbi:MULTISPECIES: carbohydrate ABC transporter permease [unclassified Paenibacillus]|uniref:carbohydrate ABC transporter permease n=1 Tax=unclassified Paenibacillus TaxID=185978 RepID=UPI001C107620|nr:MULTISPECIES: carbohydrate ABC transporter permease [unclassified Paenibacillus]MBU5442132.1 carbohydrate ABC transporter permease [Paenibacillus sp. MSJ-34]CAH0117549.1 L-arabinose transport system permease protein AraQ [Paenibacillus sp. CECT 9249]